MTLADIIIHLTDLARQTNSYAYQFEHAEPYREEVAAQGIDAGNELIEIYVTADGAVAITPCDMGGNHKDRTPISQHNNSVGDGSGVNGGAPSYREELLDALRPQVVEQVRAELAEPKKKWWKK